MGVEAANADITKRRLGRKGHPISALVPPPRPRASRVEFLACLTGAGRPARRGWRCRVAGAARIAFPCSLEPLRSAGGEGRRLGWPVGNFLTPLPFRRACDGGNRWRGRLFSRDRVGGSEGACTRPRCRLGFYCRLWRGRSWEIRVSRPARHRSILELCRLATSETPFYRSEVRILTPQIIHVHSSRKRSRRVILSSAALRTRASWLASSGFAARKRSSRAVSTSAEGGTRSLATRAAAAFGRAVQ